MDKKKQQVDWYPLGNVSYSIISSFESCPVSWYLKYFCNINWPMNEKMTNGVIFQDTLNLKYGGKEYTTKLKELNDWKKINDIIDILPDIDDIVSIDTPHFVDFGLGIPLKFTPDFLTKDKIIDAKLTGGYYNKNSVQTMNQLTIYKEGVKRLYGRDTELYYWIINNKKYTFEEVKVNKTDKDTEEMINWFKKNLEKIKECYYTKQWIIPQHSRFKCNLGVSCPISG